MEQTQIAITQKTEIFEKVARQYCRTWVKMEDANFARNVPEALKYLHQARGIVEAITAMGYDEIEFLDYYKANSEPWYKEDIREWVAKKRKNIEMSGEFVPYL